MRIMRVSEPFSDWMGHMKEQDWHRRLAPERHAPPGSRKRRWGDAISYKFHGRFSRRILVGQVSPV